MKEYIILATNRALNNRTVYLSMTGDWTIERGFARRNNWTVSRIDAKDIALMFEDDMDIIDIAVVRS